MAELVSALGLIGLALTVVGLYGFQIEGLQTSPNPNPSGVAVFRDSDHVFVWNNTIHDFPGGGVNDFYTPATTYDGALLPAGGWEGQSYDGTVSIGGTLSVPLVVTLSSSDVTALTVPATVTIPAGQTVELQLAIDVSGGLSAGNTTGFALTSASAVTAYGANNAAITPTGSFPLNGNIFTVTSVTNPSLAYVSSTPASIGTSITAGSQGDIVAAYTFNVGNSKVYLKNINFHVIGSANKGDIQNVKLLVNGAQVGDQALIVVVRTSLLVTRSQRLSQTSIRTRAVAT